MKNRGLFGTDRNADHHWEPKRQFAEADHYRSKILAEFFEFKLSVISLLVITLWALVDNLQKQNIVLQIYSYSW